MNELSPLDHVQHVPSTTTVDQLSQEVTVPITDTATVPYMPPAPQPSGVRLHEAYDGVTPPAFLDPDTQQPLPNGGMAVPLPPTRSQQPTASHTEMPKPRRSWRKSGTAGAYDFAFQSVDSISGDVATVLCVHTKRLEEVEEMQDFLVDNAYQTKERAEELAKALQPQTVKVPDPDNASKELVQEVLKTPDEIKELKTRVRGLMLGATQKQTAFYRSLVDECVIGWIDGPEPFSVEARGDLPDDLVSEWGQEIMNRSHLTEKERRFL